VQTTPDSGIQLLHGLLAAAKSGLRSGPDAWTPSLEALGSWYARASEAERASLRDAVGSSEGAILLGLSMQLCTAAARRRDAKYLDLALLCHVLEDFEQDERDNVRLLALVEHVAQKLGAPPRPLFDAAISHASRRGRALLKEFANRPPQTKTLATMRLEEVETPGGVSYREKEVPFPDW
jgi:hypothetical protein